MRDGVYTSVRKSVLYRVYNNSPVIPIGASLAEETEIRLDFQERFNAELNDRITVIENNNYVALNRILDRGGL